MENTLTSKQRTGRIIDISAKANIAMQYCPQSLTDIPDKKSTPKELVTVDLLTSLLKKYDVDYLVLSEYIDLKNTTIKSPNLILLMIDDPMEENFIHDQLKKIQTTFTNSEIIIVADKINVSLAKKTLKLGVREIFQQDENLLINFNKAIKQHVKRQEIKKKINALSTIIKRDQLVMRGYLWMFYTIVAVALSRILF